MKITIRRAEEKDIEQVMALLHTTDFIDQETRFNSKGYFIKSVSDGVFFVAESCKKLLE